MLQDIKFVTLLALITIGAFFGNKHIEKQINELNSLEVLKGTKVFAENPNQAYADTLINKLGYDSSWEVGEETGTSDQPLIAGESGFLVDINTGKVLFAKEGTKQLPIASLTKIMTAVVALEHAAPTKKIFVTRNAAYVGENTMYLTAGETYTLEELLYGLLLNSGNDAAYAIAEGVAGDFDTYVEWMNVKAKELGMNNTIYKDPSGLNDGNLSSGEDLVKLTRYAMGFDLFAKIVATKTYEISSDTHKTTYLENQTNLLGTYPGVAGVKTGYTEVAGLCLVTYASNEGHDLVGVVLNSIDRKGDMILMLDHGFWTLGLDIEHNLL